MARTVYIEALSKTPQTSPVPGKIQIKNNAGGYVSEISLKSSFKRFLILGSDANTYYQSARELTAQNAARAIEYIKKDGIDAVNSIVEVSVGGLGAKQSPQIFALAMALTFGNANTKVYARSKVNAVLRTGASILEFAAYLDSMRGWGSAAKKTVGAWYKGLDPKSLAFQTTKYGQRKGWSHRDLLRLSHPQFSNTHTEEVVKYLVSAKDLADRSLEHFTANESANYIHAIHTVQSIWKSDKVYGTKEKIISGLVAEYNLPWEVLPTELLNSRLIWQNLLPHMGLRALLWNLGRLSSDKLNMVGPLSDNESLIVRKFSDESTIQRSRLHPMTIYQAMKTYANGRGDKGSLTWNPNRNVVSALEGAFYSAFKYVEPSGKKIFLGMDVSSSMRSAFNGNLNAAEVSAIMAMSIIRSEPTTYAMGFSRTFVDLPFLTKTASLNDVMRGINNIPYGGTDCSLPMVYAKENNIPVDGFVVFTDNETYSGRIHPFQALKDYRNSASGPRDAMLIVAGVTATNFTIADPSDPGMLDIVGFDSSVPALVSNKLAGKF